MSQITSPQYRKAFILVTTLFFMWGLSYGLIDVLNKHFQVTLNVSKAQSGLIQAAYFGAYFVVAIPAGLFMEWKGYKAGILCGLSLYAIGALLFVPAAGVASFTFFLFALYEKNGLPLEKIIKNIVQVCFIRPKVRPYETDNFYAVLQRQDILDKEVYRIVSGKNKVKPRRQKAD